MNTTAARTAAAFVLFVLLVLGAPAEETVFHGSVYVRIDEEQELTSRVFTLVGPTRWFFLLRTDMVLHTEIDAPPGYRGEELLLGKPFDEVDMIAGVEAGPLIIGPVQGRGLYHRLRDPTAGGVGWSALREESRFVPELDPTVQDRRGAALSIAPGPDPPPAGGGAWVLERDERYRLEGVDGWIAPLPDARIGRFGVTLGRVKWADALLEDWEDEAWFVPLSAPRDSQYRTQAISWWYDQNYRRDASPWLDTLEPRALAEVWRQRGGTAPPYAAGTAFFSLGPPVLRGAVRVAGAEAGFRTLENSRPGASRLIAGELSHRSVHRSLTVDASLRSSRSRGWEDEVPGPARDEHQGVIRAERIRLAWFSVLQQLSFIGGVRHRPEEDEKESPPIYRGEPGMVMLVPVAPERDGSIRIQTGVAVDSDGERTFHGAVTLRGTVPTEGIPERTYSVSGTGRVRWQDHGLDSWYWTFGCSLPIRRGLRFSFHVRRETEVGRDGVEEESSGHATLLYGW